MECPACGKVIVHDEEPADFIVCPYCFEGVALRNGDPHALGKMSSLSATPSPFRVGATGSIAGRGFSILGRVRYAWDGGYWDEWYVGLMNGTHAWISEDGGEYTFERWAELDQPPER